MSRRVRRAAVTAAATLLCAAAATPAHGQDGEGGQAFDNPTLQDDFPGGSGAQRTPTPTPEPTSTRTPRPTATPTSRPTATPTASPTPEPTASPTATPRPGRRGNGEDLPNTGSDPLRVGLMGLTLLGFGLSLRLRVGDARRSD